MHDNTNGRVTALACSHDDSYLVTGGADGNVFVYSATFPLPVERHIRHPIPSVWLPYIHTVLMHLILFSFLPLVCWGSP